jgi:hypothetical protein
LKKTTQKEDGHDDDEIAKGGDAGRVDRGRRNHAKAGLPITVLSMVFAGLWLWFGGFMPL